MKRREIIQQLLAKNIAYDPNGTKEELIALLGRHQNRISKTLNYGGCGKISIAFNKADENEPAEILICEEIGKDPWSGEGITAKDIQNILNEITPKTRTLNFLTNSPGGSVSEGTAIHNILDAWPGRITNTIIGIAASTASWCIPADETRAYKNSQMFLHRSWGYVAGNADDMRSAIAFLETTDKQISEMLADHSDKTSEEMLNLMKEETLLTGQQAKDLGLVDTLIDGEAKNIFTTEQLNSMKSKLAALNSQRSAQQGADQQKNQKQEIAMIKKIALLNKRGITVPENATEAQLDKLIEASDISRTMNIAFLNEWRVQFDAENSTDAQLVALVKNGKPAPTQQQNNVDIENLIKELRQTALNARRQTIQNAVEKYASAEGGNKIPVLEIENWVNDAVAATDDPVKGNPVLNRLAKLEDRAPGVPPISDKVPTSIEGGDPSFNEVQKFILSNGPGFRRQFLGAKAQNEVDKSILREISTRAIIAANTISKHKNMLISMFNSNAIDADLQRQVILQDMLEAYALNLLPLEAFSVKYENVPLQGTDEVVVPYFPLQGNASVQFVKGTGYTTPNDWTQNSRKITVGGDGDAATSGDNATAGYAKDRLYQRIDFTSYDMRRQPYLNVMKLGQQAANKLAVDIMTQIYSRVIVTGNFGAAVKTVAAALFTPDDVADLSEYADTAEWPVEARSLVLTNTYKTPLLKDATFKQYLSYGSTDPIRKAKIQEAYGFQDMYFVPNLAAKLAANIVGWINHQSAVGVAFAPIMPSPEVRNLLTTYDVAVEPRSGAVLEYRKFGDATKDQTQEVIESSFGAAPFVQTALQIIKKP